MKISFIQAGGTIDKDYPRTTQGYAFEISEPAVSRILAKLNPTFQYEIIPLLKKDSMELTDEDRELLLETCINRDTDKIIITHGTDTMIETATFLNNIENKTIIITGAMKPERFIDSDAEINIGMALGAVITLPQGIYITMHGNIFKWDEVSRNLKTGQFKEKSVT
jgi:L-asparaginase